jgi:hypothetical protein
MKDNQCRPVPGIPPLSPEWRHHEVTSPASRPLMWFSQTYHHSVGLQMEMILMVDVTSTQAQAKDLAPPVSQGEA